jgi:hypothetical protein
LAAEQNTLTSGRKIFYIRPSAKRITGSISKELLLEWITGVLYGTLETDEALKLKILQAISEKPACNCTWTGNPLIL